MHQSSFAILFAATAALTAQSPLTTLYSGSALLNAPTVYFNDFVVNVPIQITQIDVNSNSAFGTPGTLQVYYAPGSRVGIETNVGAWTLVATANVTSAGTNQPTVGVLNTAIVLPVGNHTLAIQSNGISSYYSTSTGLNYSTAELTLLNGGGSANGALGTAVCCQPRTWNGSFHYVPGGSGTVATSTSYGTGCPALSSGSTFYELFPNGTFDLSNATLQLVPTGGGYIVLPGANTWRTPTGPALPLTDDSVSAAQPLGFTLGYPGGTTSAVYVSSNGFVWAQPSTVNGCCAGSSALLLTSGARWCPNWGDLNPGAGGTVQFDTDPVNNAAYVTFTNVPEYGAAANLNTFQVAFFANGVVEYRYQGCMQANRVVLTGWSAGENSSDPGSVDISASMPIVTGVERRPLGLAAGSRPIAGNTIQLVTSNITPSAPFGATVLSLAQINLDLSFLGMPGCYQYTGGEASLLFLPAGAATFSQPITVPNLVGYHIYCQSAVYDPAAGVTPFGAVSSNGVDLRIGNY